MKSIPANQLTFKKIFAFWLPMFATWIMMSIEGPFLTAIIARMAEAKFNLAAYGVAFSFALLVEAPVIMMLSAATALVKDRDSFFKLRRFTFFLNLIMTGIMIALIIPPVSEFVFSNIIGLPPEVARLTRLTMVFLIPWPGTIGFRRFYQGVLISHGLTRRVAYGTIIRIATMSLTALIIYLFFTVEGSIAGGIALSAGVTVEAIASRLMAHRCVKALESESPSETSNHPILTYGSILQFYYPLALTSMIGLGVHPVLTLFMGQSRLALESLAVYPVVVALVFIFRSIGLSYQEVAIALMGTRFESFERVKRFAIGLIIFAAGALTFLAFTPLGELWYRHVAGLTPELAALAIKSTRILAVIPGLSVLLSFQRAIQVNARRTGPITAATAIEVIGTVLILFAAIELFDAVGVIAAMIALLLGRTAANLLLLPANASALKSLRK